MFGCGGTQWPRATITNRYGLTPPNNPQKNAPVGRRCLVRSKGDGLTHHSDRRSQYVAIKYTERLAEAGVGPSVGKVGDSYDNALAETINGIYKTEVIRSRGAWRT